MNPKADNAWQYLRISLRYVNWRHFILASSTLQRKYEVKYFSVAAAHQGMTCWKPAIPVILMFFRRSSHCDIIIYEALDE